MGRHADVRATGQVRCQVLNVHMGTVGTVTSLIRHMNTGGCLQKSEKVRLLSKYA